MGGGGKGQPIAQRQGAMYTSAFSFMWGGQAPAHWDAPSLCQRNSTEYMETQTFQSPRAWPDEDFNGHNQRQLLASADFY